MARYRLVCAVVGKPDNGAYARYGTGQTICDSSANQVMNGNGAGKPDWIWPTLCNSPNPNQLVALDAAGASALGLAIGQWGGTAGYGSGQG
jgi:hypothetical protein